VVDAAVVARAGGELELASGDRARVRRGKVDGRRRVLVLGDRFLDVGRRGGSSAGSAMTVHAALAPGDSTLPEASVERTWTVCAPSPRPETAYGLVHGAHAPASRRHCEVAPDGGLQSVLTPVAGRPLPPQRVLFEAVYPVVSPVASELRLSMTLSEKSVGPAHPDPRSHWVPPPGPGQTVLWRMLTLRAGPKIWEGESCQVGHRLTGSQATTGGR
jgi:hypothetical protein